jgi:hypothetical protein
MQTERKIVSRWIEDRAAERDSPALTWVLQRAAWGLRQCYPPDVGKYMVLAAVQGILGDEPEENPGETESSPTSSQDCGRT